MKTAQVREVLDAYSKYLEDVSIKPHEILSKTPANQAEVIAHLKSMFPKMYSLLEKVEEFEARGLIKEANLVKEKLMRWLGFTQGILWQLGVYTIQELKEHNK